jgi:hypothetical protein
MIAFCGYPGTGKTINMTHFLKKQWDRGAVVVTNYECKFADYVAPDFREFIQFLETLYSIAVEKNAPVFSVPCYIGLDEASVMLNARNFKNFPEVLIDFIPQMRKVGVNICYTTQSPYYTDVNLRRLTDEWRWHWKFFPSWSWGWTHRYRLNPENPDHHAVGSMGNERITRFPRIWTNWTLSSIAQLYNTYQIVLRRSGEVFLRSEPHADIIRSIQTKEGVYAPWWRLSRRSPSLIESAELGEDSQKSSLDRGESSLEIRRKFF